jgi:plasmid stabilization system protein ParE
MAYRLTQRAAQSIVEAYLFGVDRFGTTQADRYMDLAQHLS